MKRLLIFLFLFFVSANVFADPVFFGAQGVPGKISYRQNYSINDTFTGSAGPLANHVQDIGGQPWVNINPNWTLDGSGNAINTPTLSAEIATGTLTVGTLYRITATEVDHFFTGCAVGDTFRATATTALDANNKVQSFTESELSSRVNTGFSAGYIKITGNTFAADTFCGVDGLWNASGTDGIRAYVNRTTGNAVLQAMVAGVWQSALIDAAVSYSANKDIILLFDGTYAVLFYNGAQVDTDQDISALTSIVNNTWWGMISTDSSTTISGAIIKPYVTESLFLEEF